MMRSGFLFLLLFVAAQAEPRRVVVLPFDETSTATRIRWLETAMAAQLGNNLALVNSIQVMPRSQVWRMASRLRRERKVTQWAAVADEVRRGQHGAACVYGEYQREGDEVQLRAHLAEGSNTRAAGSVRGRWTELMALQDDLAAQVLTALGETVTAEVRARMATEPTTSGSAYEAFGQAAFVWDLDTNPRGSLAEASRLYGEALRLDPRYAKAHNNLGLVLERQGMLLEAERSFERARELAPDDSSPWLNLANGYLRDGRDDEAIAMCETVRKLRPASAVADLKLGFLWQSRQRLDRAEACYRAALEADPQSALAHVNLGVLHFNANRNAEAEVAFRNAIALGHDDVATAYAHNNLGNVFRRVRKYDEALLAYRAALRFKDDYAVAAMNAGDICTLLRQREEAIRWYELAVELDPGNETARRKLSLAK